jgi:exonuclease III
MKKSYYSLLTIFALLLSFNTAQAQLFEDFETSEKSFYAGASVTLSTGDWYMEDALIGNLTNDKYNGSQGVRMDRRDGKNGNIYMEFDKTAGANELSFYLANYGSSSGNTLQVQYSTDQGSTWTNIGDEIVPTGTLEQVTIPVNMEGNIRFKFIQAAGTDRLNIDDIRITDFITPEENATIDVFVDTEIVESGALVEFAQTLTNSDRQKTVQIKNRGNEALDISTVEIQGGAYSISALTDSTLAFNESGELTITFTPDAEGQYQGVLEISSNAVNAATFTVNIAGEGYEEGTVIPISEARQVPFGTRVTVGGRITVANEFEGPVFMQDGTAGLAVFYSDLHTDVQIGDSVVVTGPITEFNPIGGTQGDFLLQIGATNDDNNISYEIIQAELKEVIPTIVTVEEMNSGAYEAQLVLIQNATISHTGVFGSNDTNYDLSDGTGQAFIRIDGSTNIGGAEAPSGAVNVVGVVDQFDGDYQLKPRFVEDLGVEEITYPGDDISKDETFEVVTWNIEWFGSAGGGPDDLETQFNNAKEVILAVDADLYAFQEIASSTQFDRLVSELDGYGGVLASFSQSQETAYLFKRATIDSLDSGLITDNMTQSNWANGRFPLFFHFNATVNGQSREIYSYNIHAKAFDDQSSYNQRYNASRELKLYLDNVRPSDNVIFIGDYNDTTIGSITNGEESPYKNYVDDSEYTIISRSLEEKGLGSQSIGSFIDHITITSELSDEYIVGSERVENTSYIGSYLSSTSDHYPVWTRFQFETLVSNEDEIADNPAGFKLEQNYPNPFNPSTNITYKLPQSSTVTLKVYDMLGREVATLVDGARMSTGDHSVSFDASNLSSGMYVYRLSTDIGQSLTRKMMLIK